MRRTRCRKFCDILFFLHTVKVASLAVSHDVRTEAEAGREARKGDKKSAKIIGVGVFSAY